MIGHMTLKKAVTASGVLTKVPLRTIYPHQSSNVLSGVPRNRIPFPEKVAAGILIGSLILATPAWIITHMDDYRTLEKPE